MGGLPAQARVGEVDLRARRPGNHDALASRRVGQRVQRRRGGGLGLAAAREGKFAETWLAPSVANKSLARTKEGLGGATFTYPENPTDEALDEYLAPLVRAPGRE